MQNKNIIDDHPIYLEASWCNQRDSWHVVGGNGLKGWWMFVHLSRFVHLWFCIGTWELVIRNCFKMWWFRFDGGHNLDDGGHNLELISMNPWKIPKNLPTLHNQNNPTTNQPTKTWWEFLPCVFLGSAIHATLKRRKSLLPVLRVSPPRRDAMARRRRG